jgi:hypothetical protein
VQANIHACTSMPCMVKIHAFFIKIQIKHHINVIQKTRAMSDPILVPFPMLWPSQLGRRCFVWGWRREMLTMW